MTRFVLALVGPTTRHETGRNTIGCRILSVTRRRFNLPDFHKRESVKNLTLVIIALFQNVHILEQNKVMGEIRSYCAWAASAARQVA